MASAEAPTREEFASFADRQTGRQGDHRLTGDHRLLAT
jgi:hypothetical protein